MPTPPAIRVQPVTPALRPQVLRLQVRPDQQRFVSPPALTLADAEQCPGSTPMAILRGSTVVGYYRIESSARAMTGRDDDTDAPGLRSFQIDAAWQGRGIGHRALAALLDDLAVRHADARRLVLAVDAGNAAALALYRRHGFAEERAMYHDGRPGPQRVLWRSLP